MLSKDNFKNIQIVSPHLIAGYFSGVVNILAGQPFDICKVRM